MPGPAQVNNPSIHPRPLSLLPSAASPVKPDIGILCLYIIYRYVVRQIDRCIG